MTSMHSQSSATCKRNHDACLRCRSAHACRKRNIARAEPRRNCQVDLIKSGAGHPRVTGRHGRAVDEECDRIDGGRRASERLACGNGGIGRAEPDREQYHGIPGLGQLRLGIRENFPWAPRMSYVPPPYVRSRPHAE